MSHIGNKEIIVPSEVNIEIKNKLIEIKGKFGIELLLLNKDLDIIYKNNTINIIKLNNLKQTHSYQGLFRSLIQNAIIGVNIKFYKTLCINGVGYKFKLEKNILEINADFSHSIQIKIPEYLNIKLDSATKLTISGISKEKVGFFSAKIRQICPPEPYKGKGICYENEKIRRKVGKTGK